MIVCWWDKESDGEGFLGTLDRPSRAFDSWGLPVNMLISGSGWAAIPDCWCDIESDGKAFVGTLNALGVAADS